MQKIDISDGHLGISLIIFIVMGLIYMTIAYFFIRWVFSIQRQLKNQEAQVSLLYRIAEKLGVDETDLDQIRTKYES